MDRPVPVDVTMDLRPRFHPAGGLAIGRDDVKGLTRVLGGFQVYAIRQLAELHRDPPRWALVGYDRACGALRCSAHPTGGDMDRLRAPTEFGFTTSPYLAPERPRPAWKTLVFGALLALIPFVGAGMSAVYIDRRTIPGTYDTAQALRTALIQIFAIALLIVLCWIVFGLILGLSIQLNPRVGRLAP